MKKIAVILKHSTVAAGILALCFLFCLLLQALFDSVALIPSMFVLCALMTSIMTPGYIYGIVTAIISVFAVNYAFTFPFFRFNISISENLISAIIMIVVSCTTCALTTKIKHQNELRFESEQERMRANLLRAISHDLRTPLTTICGASSILLENRDDLSKEQVDRMLKGICQDSQWLSRIVENLLSITKLEAGEVSIVKAPTVLDELIDSVLVKFQKRYPDTTVDVDIPDEFIAIPMDALLIEQVLINILENAVQHAENMTKLSLKVFTISDKAVFEIADNGCGIKEDRMPYLFTGYYRAHSADVDSKKCNAGIGLTVCRSIINAHGGDIRAENIKSGGALFRFTLNLEETENAEQQV